MVIAYQVKKNYCNCCGQKLENEKLSEREFHITKDNCLDWLSQDNWQIYKQEDDYDDLDYIIEEFVYETIRFFSTSLNDEIIIENSEFEKVRKLILDEIIV